jgi:carbon storage regulator
MLVLSRKIGERILVPHSQLSVTVLAIDGNTVRLGVTAPPEIGVFREELWQRVCSESEEKAPTEARANIEKNGDRRSPAMARRRI